MEMGGFPGVGSGWERIDSSSVIQGVFRSEFSISVMHSHEGSEDLVASSGVVGGFTK